MALNLFRGFGLGIWHSTGSLFKLPTLQKNILLLEEKERRRSVASSRHSKPSSDPAAVSNSATGGFAQSRSRVARHQQLQQQQQQQQQQQLSENASETAAAASTSSTLSPGGASSSSQSQQHFYQKGIFAPIFMIWAENLKLLLIPMLLLDFFLPYLVRMLLNAFLPSEDVAFVCEVGSFALYLFWKVPILVIMEVINLGHLKKISRLLGSVRKPVEAATSTRTAPSSGVLANEEVVHGLFVNRLYVPLFLLVFNLQGVVLSNVAQFLFGFYSKQIVTIVHASLLYSFYVFDYYWLDMGRPFQERYYRMRVAWPYFLGFGLPMGLFQVTWPSTISLSALGLNIVYPLLLISAYLVHWSAIKDSVTLQGSYLKLSLADIYRPSFWISNKLMHIFQRVLNRYSMIPAK